MRDLLGADPAASSAARAARGRGPATGSAPPAMRPGGMAISFRTDSAVTVLPQPDSPTTPSVSPRSIGEIDAVDRAARCRHRWRNQVFRPRISSSGSPSRRLPDHITLRGSSASRSPSPTKLMRQHGEEDRGAGEQRPMRRDVEIVLGVEQDAAPGRDVGRKAEAEERQRRFGDDRGGDVDRAGDDDRPQRIGQDVAHHLARIGGAERARRLDEFLLAQRQELRAHQARHRHPAKAADHQRRSARRRRPPGRPAPSARRGTGRSAAAAAAVAAATGTGRSATSAPRRRCRARCRRWRRRSCRR